MLDSGVGRSPTALGLHQRCREACASVRRSTPGLVLQRQPSERLLAGSGVGVKLRSCRFRDRCPSFVPLPSSNREGQVLLGQPQYRACGGRVDSRDTGGWLGLGRWRREQVTRRQTASSSGGDEWWHQAAARGCGRGQQGGSGTRPLVSSAACGVGSTCSGVRPCGRAPDESFDVLPVRSSASQDRQRLRVTSGERGRGGGA